MKTILISILMILILGTMNAKPIRDVISIKEPALVTEEYVSDIPFDTRLVASERMLIHDGWEIREEANVNDIPFDTRVIANETLLRQIMTANTEPEAGDIPFDTREIYEACMMAKLIRNYENERAASDIQFDTHGIASEHLFADAVNRFRNEAEICDVPYETVCIITSRYSNEPAYVVVKTKREKKTARWQNRMGEYEYSIIHPVRFEVPASGPDHSILTRELIVAPGPSL